MYNGPERRKELVIALDLHDARALAFMLGRIIDNEHIPETVKQNIKMWREMFSERCKIVEKEAANVGN